MCVSDEYTRRHCSDSSVMRSTPRTSVSSNPRVQRRGGNRGGKGVQFVGPPLPGLTHTTTRSGRQVKASRDEDFKCCKKL